MPPTIIGSQERTKGSQGLGTDNQVIDMMPKIYTYDSGKVPALRALTMKSQVVPVSSYEPKWQEDEPLPDWDVTTNSGNNSTTTLPVGSGTYHKAGDVLVVPRTRELMLVSSVSTNDLTVVRGVGGSTAASFNSAEPILNLGLYDTEGNTSPDAKATVPVVKSNFTRILKTPVHLSRTASQIKLYGGPERPRQRVKAAVKHARLLEQEFFHGIKSETVSGATVRRYAGGLDHFVTSNVYTATGGVISESEFFEWLGTVYRNGVDGASSTSRVLFAGQPLINTINSWGVNKLTTDSGRNKQYGFHISTLLTPYGTLDIVYHPLLENGYSDRGYVLDMSGIKIGALQRTVLQTNIQSNDEDGYKDQYLSEQTYIVINEKSHGILKNIGGS